MNGNQPVCIALISYPSSTNNNKKLTKKLNFKNQSPYECANKLFKKVNKRNNALTNINIEFLDWLYNQSNNGNKRSEYYHMIQSKSSPNSLQNKYLSNTNKSSSSSKMLTRETSQNFDRVMAVWEAFFEVCVFEGMKYNVYLLCVYNNHIIFFYCVFF